MAVTLAPSSASLGAVDLMQYSLALQFASRVITDGFMVCVLW